MAQPKSFTLDGKRYRLDPKVPARDIKWLSGHWHVSVSDVEIHEIILRRTAGKDWPDKCVQQAMNYAVYCHRRKLEGRRVLECSDEG